MHNWDLTGRVALITGVGSGLGQATANAFAEAGCTIAGLDINVEAGHENGAQTGACGSDAYIQQCDVSDASAVHQAVANVVDRSGRLDFAVNCAGIDHTVSIDEMTIDQWDQIMAVNLRGPFLVAKAVLPTMRRLQFGHIVNVASTASLRVWSDVSAYAASKWGLVGLSRALGVEGRVDGIRSTTVIPGGMRTHFFDRFSEQGIPMPDEANLQDPRTVAHVILQTVSLPPESVVQEVMVTPLNETSWP